MRPRLIHRVIARLNVGGPAMHVVNLARDLDSGPWRTRLIAGRVEETEGDMSYYADRHGVGVTYLPAMARSIRAGDDVRTLARLYRIFRAERPDVVHTHTAKAGTLGRLAARAAGVPVVVHTYHGHVLGGDYFSATKTRLFLEIERQLGRGTDRLVVLTRGQRDEMAGPLAVADPSRFAVVPLGLDLGPFEEADRARSGPEVRAEIGLGADELVLGIVGRLVPIKNHELFLEVVAEVAARSSRPVRAVVVGAGEREGELRALAARRGLEARVVWLGWRRDLPRLFTAFDALLLTSHDEGTPVAVLEALATGTRVVARRVGGVDEVLEAVGGATLVPAAAGRGAWAEGVLAAVSAPPPTAQVRASVAARFSAGRLAADLAALYERLLGGRRAGAT